MAGGAGGAGGGLVGRCRRAGPGLTGLAGLAGGPPGGGWAEGGGVRTFCCVNTASGEGGAACELDD